MSTKYVVAAAAVALVATTDATPMNRLRRELTTIAPVPALYEDAEWDFNAGISGQVGSKPNYQVGISGKWDEEQKIKIGQALDTIDRAVNIANAVGLLDEEEQGFGSKLNKALNTVDHAVNIAGAVGLLEEEQSLKKLTKAVKKVAKVAVVASEMGLLDEDEQQGVGSKLDNILNKVDKAVDTANKIKGVVDVVKSFDEEEEQKFKLGKALKKAAKVAVTAQQIGLLEDDSFLLGGEGSTWINRPQAGSSVWEEEQKFKLGKALKKAAKVAVTAQQLGLLDDSEWEFNAGINGQGGQKPNYNVGISGKWDEEQGFGSKLNKALNTIDHAVNTAQAVGLLDEEEQKFKLGKALKKVAKVAVVASEVGLLDEDEQQGFGKKLNKILDKVDRATTTAHRVQDAWNSVKSFEEADWGFNAGISGQVGGKPSYNAGISAKWDEEEQKFKLGKALKKATKVAVKANQMGLLEEQSFLGGENGKRWPQRPTPPYFLDIERF